MIAPISNTPDATSTAGLRPSTYDWPLAYEPVAVKMAEVGESTGALQEMLQSLADFYDEEIEAEVARAIALVEPVLLVLMGVVIAGVVLALYLPLFELSSVMK